MSLELFREGGKFPSSGFSDRFHVKGSFVGNNSLLPAALQKYIFHSHQRHLFPVCKEYKSVELRREEESSP
jgi:hypothetical protein